ncbi:MAG: MBG domain-containing protein [Candidatus Melainabacteria bacterium]
MIIRSRTNRHGYIAFENGRIVLLQTHAKDPPGRVTGLNRTAGFCLAATLAVSLFAGGVPAWADLPEGYTVSSGSASFSQNGSVLDIHASSGAIINYQRFNIGAGNRVNVYSPLSLHRVTSGEPSRIFGTLYSPGKVFLVNPGGIIFGAGSSVNVQGLVASTLNIRDADFLSGQYVFQADSSGAGAVASHGEIFGAESVGLIGGSVDNTGHITAPRVDVAVGDRVTYTVADGVGIDVTVDESLRQEVAGAQAAIRNTGTIEGQQVALQARLARSFYQSTVNNSGVVKATGFAQDQQGHIVARAQTDTRDGRLVNTGTVTARGGDAQTGGHIDLLGDQVEVQAGSLVDASGGAGGGYVRIGGDYQGLNDDVLNARNTWVADGATVDAAARLSGDGGRLIVWGDEQTIVDGHLSVHGVDHGGFIETSGKQYLSVTGLPDISADSGQGGTWLLDPNDISIVAGSGNTNISGTSPFNTSNDSASIGVSLITAALASGNVVISTGTAGTSAQNGDITLSTALNYTGVAGRTLTLNAHRNININSALSSTNALNVALNADTDANNTGTVTVGSAGSITTGGGSLSMNGYAISLSGTSNTGNGVANLVSGSTISASKPVITGTGLLNLTAPTSVSFNYNVNSAPLKVGTVNTPSLTLLTNGTNSSITLNNGFSGTSLALRAQGSGGFITSNGSLTVSTGNFDIRSYSNDVTINGNVTDNSLSGTTYLTAGWSSFSSGTDLNVTGTVSIAADPSKKVYVYDADGSVFSKSWFTDGGARYFDSLYLKKASASGTFNFTTLTGLANPDNLNIYTYGSAGHITTGAFTGATLLLQAQGSGSNVTVNGNVNTNTLMDIRSWTGDVTVNGNVTDTATSGSHFLAAGYNGVSTGRALSVTGAIDITGDSSMNLSVFDGDGTTFSKTYFTDGGNRAFNKLDFRRADANGGFDFDTMTAFAIPSNLTLVSMGSSGALHLGSSFNGGALTLQAQGSGSDITVDGDVITSSTMDLRSWSGDVTVNGNVTNTQAGGTHYLSAGANTFTATNNLTITGTLTVDGDAAKKLTIRDGDGSVFSQAWFTDGGNRDFDTLEFRRGDDNGSLLFGNMTGLKPGSLNTLTLQTLGDSADISFPTSFTGTSLILQAMGTNSNVLVNGNINTTTQLSALSNYGNTTINGNVTNTYTGGSATTVQLAGGYTSFSNATNLSISGTINITDSTNKSLYIYDGDGDVFSKAFFSSPMTYKNIILRSRGNGVNLGSMLNPISTAANTIQLESAGDAYLVDTSGAIQFRTTGSGVDGLLHVRSAGDITTSSTIVSGTLDMATTAADGSMLLTQNVTGTNGVTLSTNGLGAVNISNSRTLTAINADIDITTRTITLNTSGKINAGTGTVTLLPNIAESITLGGATKGSALDLTANELSKINAGALRVGSTALAGGMTLVGNVDVSGAGYGNYNLDLRNAGSYTAGSSVITLGGKQASIQTGGSLTSGEIAGGTAGSAISLVSGQNLTTTSALTADNVTLQTTGTSHAVAIGGTVTAADTVTIQTAGSSTVSQTGDVIGDILHIIASGGSVTLNNTGNDWNHVSVTRTGAGATVIRDADDVIVDTSSNATGSLSITTDSGNITVDGTVSGAGITLVADDDVIINNSASLHATGSGNSLVVAALNGTFTNSQGAGALSAGSGRWLVYSDDPAATTEGVMGYSKLYNKTYAGNPPAGIAAGANYMLYRIAPTLSVTASNASKTYGSANPSFSSAITGLIDGDTLGAAVSGAAGYSTTATSASHVGSYAVSPTLGTLASAMGYQFAYADGTLTVNPAPLSVTTDAVSKTYGAALPSFTSSYSGFVLGENSSVLGGTLSYSTTATNASNVGTYAVTPSGLISSDYTLTFNPGNLTVTKAPLTVTTDASTKVYGAALPAFGASYSGFVLGENTGVLGGSLSYSTSATNASNVGTYAVTPSGLTSGNYSFTYNPGNLTVTKAPLSVTTNAASKVYGDALPTFGVSYSGFVLSDNAASLGGSLSYSTTATNASNVGTYAVTPSGLTSGNYSLTYNPGTLTVTQAPLTVTAANASKYYGYALPSFGANYSGFKLGQDESVLGGSLSVTTPATISSTVGSYTLTASGYTSSNYSITYNTGTLSVNKAPLTVTVNDVQIPAQQALPTFGVSYSGFVLGQNQSVLGGALSYSTAANISSPPGYYAVNASGLTSGLYDFNYVAGTLTVGDPLPPMVGPLIGSGSIPYVIPPSAQSPLMTLPGFGGVVHPDEDGPLATGRAASGGAGGSGEHGANLSPEDFNGGLVPISDREWLFEEQNRPDDDRFKWEYFF